MSSAESFGLAPNLTPSALARAMSAHAHEIAHRLVRLVVNPHHGQLAGPQQQGKHHLVGGRS